jgi:leucyl-tRNA synthetase
MPVDVYVGGAEHAVLHLLYSRFWHKVLFDLGLVNSDEPFMRLINQGQILGADGQRMSKSRGNTVNPDDYVAENGADALRVFIMFMGPIEAEKPWSTAGLVGVERFLERCWAIGQKPLVETAPAPELERLLHRTIKKVGGDTSTMNYNTAISQMMIYSAELAKLDAVPRTLWEPFVLMLAPYAPHLAEELWERAGHTKSLARESWPGYDESLCIDETKEIVVQINGKIRERFNAAAGTDQATLEKTARSLPKVKEWTEGKEIAKVIVVKDKLVNIVVKN